MFTSYYTLGKGMASSFPSTQLPGYTELLIVVWQSFYKKGNGAFQSLRKRTRSHGNSHILNEDSKKLWTRTYITEQEYVEIDDHRYAEGV